MLKLLDFRGRKATMLREVALREVASAAGGALIGHQEEHGVSRKTRSSAFSRGIERLVRFWSQLRKSG
jgi:hypothetical protein